VVYHDISTAQSNWHSEHYSTEPQLFKEHIRFFQKNFSIVSLDELANVKGRGNHLAIAFDDGFKSIKDSAVPFLQANNIPFTVFSE